MYRLSDYISEAVSHGYKHKYGHPKPESTKEEIILWLEGIGFKKVTYLPMGHKYPCYRIDGENGITLKFETRSGDVYVGMFKTGEFPMTTLVDITHAGSSKHYAGITNGSSEEERDIICKFIETYVKS